jgi:stage V sporulation protein R
MNEGWASYWHEKLFLQDDRIKGHEVDFARVHAGVTSLPRVGLNPYALGMRLFTWLDELGDTGRYSLAYQRLAGAESRKRFDTGAGQGQEFIFRVRENLCDYLFVKEFIDQDFTDRYKLFVVDRRLDQQRQVWQYFVKSRKSEDYRQMLLDTLYHPPVIEVDQERTYGGQLSLAHRFEGKQLVQEYLANTLLGIGFLWGGPVSLETNEAVMERSAGAGQREEVAGGDIRWQRVKYTMQDKVLSREVM